MTELSDEIGRDRDREQFGRSSERALNQSGIIQGRDDMIDQDARDRATTAFSRMESHEKLCTERWAEMRKALEDIREELKECRTSLNKRIGTMPAGIMTVMGSIIGFLANFALTHMH